MKKFFKGIFELRLFLSRHDERKLIGLFLLMLVASFLDAIGIAAIPAFVSFVMNPASLSQNQWIGGWFGQFPMKITSEMLMWASGIFICFTVFKNIFLSLVFYVQARMIVLIRVKVSSVMFKRYQHAPYEWILQRNSSEMIRNIENDSMQVATGIALPMLDFVLSLIVSIMVLVVMLINSPNEVLIGLSVTGIGLIVIIRLLHGRLKLTGDIFRFEYNKIIQAIQQGFGALVDSRIIGCEPYFRREHKSALDRQGGALYVRTAIQQSTPYAVETFAIIGLLLTVVWLIIVQDSAEGILPILALLGVATIRLKQTTGKIANTLNKMISSLPFLHGIANDFKELDAPENNHREGNLNGHTWSAFEKLSLRHISYTYPGTDILALDDISLEIKAGESIAFVGSSGSGKSTLIHLMLGLLVAQEGTLRFNQNEIFQHLDVWRSHIGYIPQSIYLIDDSLRANIAFGVAPEDVDEERLLSALRSAQLEKFIDDLPQGLDAVVGERGTRISGGQRQRLGIARALYTDPDVLIMDEATSALDNATEIEVIQAIKNLKKDRTLIMIAHRLSTVKDCDRLLFLSSGSIEHSGTFEELKRISPAFCQMAKLELTENHPGQS